MKTIMKFAAIIATVMAICSCGTSQKTVSDSSYNSSLQSTQVVNKIETPARKVRPTEPCEELAWEREFAAVGTATSYNEKTARNEAVRNARNELGRMMQVAVEGAAEDYLRNVSKNKKSTAETISEEVTNEFFAECVNNSKVIKTSVYDLADGQIQVYACVEVVTSFKPLDKATEITENVLSNNEVLEVEFNKEQFKNKIKEGLQAYKENRKQQ